MELGKNLCYWLNVATYSASPTDIQNTIRFNASCCWTSRHTRDAHPRRWRRTSMGTWGNTRRASMVTRGNTRPRGALRMKLNVDNNSPVGYSTPRLNLCWLESGMIPKLHCAQEEWTKQSHKVLGRQGMSGWSHRHMEKKWKGGGWVVSGPNF